MDIATAIRRLQLHATYVDDDVGHLTDLLADLLDGLGEIERTAVLRHAYWRMPGVPTAVLQAALGGDGPLRRAVGRGPVVGSCPSCWRVVRARSRDDVDVSPSSPCAECRVQPTRAAVTRTRPGFTWEFGETPSPWLPAPVERVVAGDRRWAEHYPTREPAA